MSGALKTLSPGTCAVIDSAISSRESVAGLTPWLLPDGRMIDPCGLVRALANLSARQVKELGLTISGTSGPPSSTSSASAGLQQCLENRLRERLQARGSTLYTLTWKGWTTPSGVCRSRQRALALRTSVIASIGSVPTPVASEGRDRSRPEVLARVDKGGRIGRWICARSSTARLHQDVVILNPSFAGWMMGFPVQWWECRLSATQSFRKPQQSS